MSAVSVSVPALPPLCLCLRLLLLLLLRLCLPCLQFMMVGFTRSDDPNADNNTLAGDQPLLTLTRELFGAVSQTACKRIRLTRCTDSARGSTQGSRS
jgi:hypothetical protein